ncbi:MAG TPA: hypothetical protein PK299_10430 [Anaerolineales bacterium]|nr:hypothetical protein [Anaerolineales bacterium]
MFTNPTPTQFDLRFEVAGFPVRISPMFWLIVVLFGFNGDPLQLVTWVFALFISILLHELGHALAFRRFGVESEIVLYGFGGLAIPRTSWGRGLSSTQNILVALAGPFAGFLLAAVILLAVKLAGGVVLWQTIVNFIPVPIAGFQGELSFLNELISTFLWVNVFWGMINLLPIYPLDGGQVTRHAFLMSNAYNGVQMSLWVSVIVGAMVAIWAFAGLGSIYMGAMFAMLALQSFMQIRR